jgi:hypothetical protein
MTAALLVAILVVVVLAAPEVVGGAVIAGPALGSAFSALGMRLVTVGP